MNKLRHAGPDKHGFRSINQTEGILSTNKSTISQSRILTAGACGETTLSSNKIGGNMRQGMASAKAGGHFFK